MSDVQAESGVSGDAVENGASVEKNEENQEISLGKIEINTPKALSEAERLEQRLKKFGAQSENAKKSLRAQRFGLSASGGESDPKDKSKLEKRAQRFGTAPSTPTSGDPEVMEKRAKRFGIANSTTTTNSSVPDDILAKRKERFGLTDEEAKKKLRSQRFENKA